MLKNDVFIASELRRRKSNPIYVALIVGNDITYVVSDDYMFPTLQLHFAKITVQEKRQILRYRKRSKHIKYLPKIAGRALHSLTFCEICLYFIDLKSKQ